MNSSIIWRIVWKDYRTYRPLWLGLLVISVVIQALVVAICLWSGDPASVTGTPIVMALAMPVVFAVAVSSVTFSQEHEVGTYGYLRSLPVDSLELFVGRLLHGLIGTVALFVVLMLLLPMSVSLAPTGIRISDTVDGIAGFWLTSASMSLLAVACGTFCSLLTKHPLRAAFAAAAIVCVIQLVGSINTGVVHVQLALAVAVVVLLVDIVLVRVWLADTGERRSELLAHHFTINTRAGFFRSVMGRLIWVHLRRLGLVYLAMTGLVLMSLKGGSAAETPVWLVLTQVFAGGLGLSVFYVDHRDQAYRFYATHGVSPRLVWATRHAVGFLLLLVFCTCVHVAALKLSISDNPRILALSLMPLLAYSGGQLTMLLSRSPLIALFASFTLSLVLGAWCCVTFWLQVPWWIAVLPLLIAGMVASWAYMPNWVLERTGSRQKAVPLGIVAAGVVVTVLSFSVYRVVEIPSVQELASAGDELHELTPNQQAAKTNLERAVDTVSALPNVWFNKQSWHPNDLDYSDTGLWRPPESREFASVWLKEDDWAKDNVEALAQVELAFEETDELVLPTSQTSDQSLLRPELLTLNRLLIIKGDHLTWQGELDAARQKYRQALELAIQIRSEGGLTEWAGASQSETLVYEQLIWWAAHEQQTAERIQQAIQFLVELQERYPDCARAYARSYEARDLVIRNAPDSLMNWGFSSNEIPRVAFVYQLMPWERVRSRRALRYFEHNELDNLRDYARAIREDRNVNSLLRSHAYSLVDEPSVRRSLLVSNLVSSGYVFSDMDAMMRNRNRAAILQLALIAWKKQHGQYPDSLATALEELSVPMQDDVYTGRPFVYFPQGKNCRLPIDLNGRLVPYPADHPFLWSPKVFLDKVGADPTDHVSYVFAGPARPNTQLADATREETIWQAGEIYGLPVE